MHRRVLSVSFLLIFLAACGPGTTTTPPQSTQILPTEAIFPTFTTQSTSVQALPTTPQATFTEPKSSPTAEIQTEPPVEETLPPTLSPIPQTTAASTGVPQPFGNASTIQLYSPGPQSKIVSPLNVYGYAVPGYKNRGRVDLYGEDGRLINSELLQLNTSSRWAYFYWPLPFTITSVGELGRLTMSTQDKYGRITALYSVHVLLLPEGESIVSPPVDLQERCVLAQPAEGKRLSGGTLTVSGEMLPFNDLPLRVELIDRDGNILNSQLVPIAPAGGESVPFRVDVPYTLSRSSYVLLVVSQFDDRIDGLMYLFSREILLYP